MRYATVCSGIDAPALAWDPLGWEQVFSSETGWWNKKTERYDTFPCKVLAHHHPNVPNLGDMTKIKGKEHAGTIDVLCGGTPCTDYSLAGKRAGMDGESGRLTPAFVKLAGQIRSDWVLWENVPGVLSSNEGRDFGRFLFEMEQCGYKAATWASLDAQYFHLAQRRQRVFVVFRLGTDWRGPAAVLFDRESMLGNSPPIREPHEGLAGCLDAGSGKRRGSGQNPALLAPCATASNYLGDGDGEDGLLVPTLSNALLSQSGQGYHREETFVAEQPIPILEAGARTGKSSAGPRAGIGIGQPGDPMYTLQAGKQHAVAFDLAQVTSGQNRSNPSPGDPCPTLAGTSRTAVAFDLRGREGGAQMEGPHDTANIRAASGGSSASYVVHGTQDPIVSDIAHALGTNAGQENVLVEEMRVRRLLPVEWEKLQGFPRNFTHIPVKKVSPDRLTDPRSYYEYVTINGEVWQLAADSPRYKALGNTIAVPPLVWIGKRIEMVDRL
ncbi:MAG: DNA cytosine methyltransferase [Gammaproteobacteria bacterium]